jgi:nucleotide-binding universal stress UspA family protein
MFKQIVVALDGSEHGWQALEYARHLAECEGGSLWLVHAFPHTSDLRGYEAYDRLISERTEAGQVILNEARERLGDASLKVNEELLEGPPAEAIMKVAEARDADLIVMGTRGLGSLRGLLLGSVSSKVVQHASCAVMLAR